MRICYFMALLAVLSIPCFSATWYVDPLGPIQDMIDNAIPGDTIKVPPGTYYENLIITKKLTIQSIGGPSVTEINGSMPSDPDFGSVVTITGSQASGTVLDGFTITGGTGTLESGDGSLTGGGIYIYNCSPTIINNIIKDNILEQAVVGHAWGGGLFCELGNPTITDNIFTSNCVYGIRTSYQSGVGKGGGLYLLDSTGTIHDNIITENKADGSGGYPWTPFGGFGGGICFENCTASIMQNTITDNRAEGGSDGNGGGICCLSASPPIEENTIENNHADVSGGGIYCDGSSSGTIRNNTINNNYSDGNSGGVKGGNCIITENDITNNSADGGSGGVSGGDEISYNLISNNVAGGHAGGVSACNNVIHNTITNNDAAGKAGGILTTGGSGDYRHNLILGNIGDDGGGICSPDNADETMYITDNHIRENVARQFGGGIYMKYGKATFENNTVRDNQAVNDGGGFYLTRSGGTYLNNAVEFNQAGGEGGGFYLMKSGGSFLNNMVDYNEAGTYGGGFYTTTSTPYLLNNTICYNKATVHMGGGAYFYDHHGSSAIIAVVNTIFWGNTAPTGPQIAVEDHTGSTQTELDIGYSDVQGGSTLVYVGSTATLTWGPGMIDSDPLFVDPLDPDHPDFHLKYTSPCRDTGWNDAPDLPATDFEGDPRIAWNGTVDMGADEFYTHLYYKGEATPLETIKVRIIGKAGATPAGLFLGTGVLPDPLVHKWGLFWLESPWFAFPLGAMGSDGVITIPAEVPTSPAIPWDLPIQALVGKESDSLTNLCVIEVR